MRYRGTPVFDENGEEYVQYLPGETKYVGEPSDEIDEAWNQLTKSTLKAVMGWFRQLTAVSYQGASSCCQKKKHGYNSGQSTDNTGMKAGEAMQQGE